MLTLAVRLKIVAFLVIGTVAVGYLGVNYADVGRYIGVRDYFEMKVELRETGGLYPNADVTYRGVSVGRIGSIDLTEDGVEATVRIDKSAPDIPEDSTAIVASLSAIGEQYLDLRPRTDSAPYLDGDTVIPVRDTDTPAPVTDMLNSLNDMVVSVPLDSLRTVMDELGTALEGQGDNLGGLLDAEYEFVRAAAEALPETTDFIVDAQTVLTTQAEQGDALREFAAGAADLSAQLRESDSDLRNVINAGPGAAAQVSGLLRDVDPGLSVLIANLLTTSDVMVTRQRGFEELLVQAPRVVAAGSTAVGPDGINTGMAVTFFQPMPCTQGYGGTTYRNGLDTSSAPLNTEAACTASPGSGQNVRGSQNAPYGGGVPDAAVPGSLRAGGGGELPGALGLPGTGGSGSGGMDDLLGMGGD
ncbi:MlaD family protein [Streptomyces sp. NBC_01803]|uniref:MlaD family protein n=1 Tax=Streptomyces sp. NBC_01803 TaxID=2975946 RepID=UPI002DDAC0C2|nr:MlaD family protein [Streptomyces sp. NBC_01803]WSA43560.1 MCE family protein [Streptomyces sp. NBC_01803]